MKNITIIDTSQGNHKEVSDICQYISNSFKNNELDFFTFKISTSHIVNCTQCRCCTQKKSQEPVKCFVHDEMDMIIDTFEKSDYFIFVSDTNSIFSENEVYKKFLERLTGYFYWPYGQEEPSYRKLKEDKKSVLINYNTSSFFVSKSFETCVESLSKASRAIGAEVTKTLLITPEEKQINLKIDELVKNLIM